MSEVANPYTINSLRSQYRTHVVSNPPAQTDARYESRITPNDYHQDPRSS